MFHQIRAKEIPALEGALHSVGLQCARMKYHIPPDKNKKNI